MAGERRETNLGELIDFLSGGTPSKENPSYWNGSVPWVSAKDMKHLFIDDTEDHVTEEGVTNGTKLVPKNTVLLLTRGMTLLNDVPICIARRPLTFNQDVKAMRPKGGIDESFLPYLLLGNKHRLLALVDLAGHGTGRLNTDELKSFDVSLPPHPEQRAIAHVLGTLDDKIELNRRTNETLEAIVQALFKSWFVDFDPVRAKAQGCHLSLPKTIAGLFPDSFRDSDLGRIPTGWPLRSLYGCAVFTNGLAFRNEAFSQERRGLPVIKIAELKSGVTSQTKFTEAEYDPKYRVTSGDILFSWSGSPDTSIDMFVLADRDGWLNQHIFKLEFKPHERSFIYVLLRHLKGQFIEIARNKQTTGLGHVTADDLKRLQVVFPPDQMVRAFDGLVRPLLGKVHASRVESRTLVELRDTLLPKLISGEIRVKGTAGKEPDGRHRSYAS